VERERVDRGKIVGAGCLICPLWGFFLPNVDSGLVKRLGLAIKKNFFEGGGEEY